VSNTEAVDAPSSQADYGSMIRNQQQKVEKIQTHLSSVYQPMIADGKLTNKALGVLSETLSRVSILDEDLTRVNIKSFPTPEECYLWGVANASIVFPYMTLKSATENMKDSSYSLRDWGIKDGVYHLPRVESVDSPMWVLLTQIIAAKHGENCVRLDALPGETVPDLHADTCAKEPLLDTVVIRILELVRNPLSATIRRTELEKAETNIRNAVDFVILEKIYKDNEDYNNLTLSGPAISAGRRSRRVESKGTGNKVTYTTVYLGYKLAEMLCKYIPKLSAKSPEGETFVQTILGFIRSLVPEDVGNYTIPQSFFETPSNQLRAMVREGPRIKTKKGEKHNLYVPLSFVKSSECASYPEVIRKEIIDTGSQVLKNLDSVNKLPVKNANKVIPGLKEYLTLSYTISDQSRKEWRQRARTPSLQALKSALIDNFPDLEESDEDSLSQYITRSKACLSRMSFNEVFTNEEEKAAELLKISSILTEKKTKREKR